jgi:excisionase family DNA binding protein
MSRQPALSIDTHDAELAVLVERFELAKRSYSRREVAQILGVSESGVDRLLKSKKLASFRVGERVIVARRDLAEFLYEGQRGSPRPPLLKSEPKPKSQRQLGRPCKRKARKHG